MSSVDLQQTIDRYQQISTRARRRAFVANVLMILTGIGWLAWSAIKVNDSLAEADRAQQRTTQEVAKLKRAEANLAALTSKIEVTEKDLSEKKALLQETEEQLENAHEDLGEIRESIESNESSQKKLKAVASVFSAERQDATDRWNKGQAAYKGGDPERARKIWKTLTEEHPRYAPAYSSLGKYEDDIKGDHPAAKDFFEKALQCRPKYFPAMFNLARIALADKKWAEADEWCQKADKARPGQASTKRMAEQLKRHGFDCGIGDN